MRESAPLSALRARIATLGHDRAVYSNARMSFGHGPLDAWLDGGLKRAQLHEIFTEDAEDAGSVAGFAAMLALIAQDEGRSLVWLRTRQAERRGGRFHAAGFAELGGDPGSVLLAVVPDTISLLRGAVEALRCAGLCAVIAECWGYSPELDLMASRRLTLAAERSGVTALMLRAGANPAPSTADTRWSIRSAPSRSMEACAPGHPALDLTLLRRRGGPAEKSWRVEWDRERRCFAEPARTPAREPAQKQTISGAALPLPAGRPAEDRGATLLARTA
jgi:protein ImuA